MEREQARLPNLFSLCQRPHGLANLPLIMHSALRLILLSRIDGDAPRAESKFALVVWIVREQAVVNFRSRSFKSIRTPVPSSDYRFSEDNPIRSFFCSLWREKVQICL